MELRELTPKEVAREIEKRVRASHWPPEGAEVTRVQIDLIERRPDALTSEQRAGYRVRKAEFYGERHYKKYGLSWKTGEWMLVPDGGRYAEETFLEIPAPAKPLYSVSGDATRLVTGSQPQSPSWSQWGPPSRCHDHPEGWIIIREQVSQRKFLWIRVGKPTIFNREAHCAECGRALNPTPAEGREKIGATEA